MAIIDFCEILDSLMTLDFGARGQIGALYKHAREMQGNLPLSKLALDFFKRNIKPNGTVIITTGWLIPGFPQNIGEPDGPHGVAAIVRALDAVFKTRSIVLTEKPIIPMVTATLRGLGLNPVKLDSLNTAPRPVSIMSFPTNLVDAKKEAPVLLDRFKPSAIISVEKGGVNEKGHYHITVGINATKGHIRADELFFEGARRGIPTMGVGDGGNEIGMGGIREKILEEFPFLAKCKCKCGGGVLSITKADRIIVGATSNLACYSMAAGLAANYGRPNSFFNADEESRMALAAANAGAVDGILGYSSISCDGVPGRITNLIVELLNMLVDRYINGQPGEDLWAFQSSCWKTWVESILEQRKKG